MTVTLSGVTLRGVSLCPFSPAQLFLASEKGVWYDPSDLGTVYADVAGTTLASVDGPVGKILDKSGNGKHATAAADNTTRPTLRYSGGLYYLEFDGSNDALSTASIDFTNTAKVTALAGVRKLSDAAGGIVFELSASDASNNSAFHIAAPFTSGFGDFAFFSKATTRVIAQTLLPYNAPISSVLCGIGDTTAPLATLRVNGSNAVTTEDSQGTGNYGNYPLYIGARAGSSLYFNGRLYSLIVRGAATSSADIIKAETWVNRKTGAY